MKEHLSDEALSIVIHLIDQSFTTGKFHDHLKISFILHKAGGPESSSNYLPFAPLPTITEFIEKTENRIFHENKIIKNKQFVKSKNIMGAIYYLKFTRNQW